MRQAIGVHGVRTPQFWPCGVHLYVDTPRIFDHLIVNYICYCVLL